MLSTNLNKVIDDQEFFSSLNIKPEKFKNFIEYNKLFLKRNSVFSFYYDIISMNDPFLNINNPFFDMLEVKVMNNIVKDPEKAKQLRNTIKNSVIEYVKGKLYDLGYKEMYVSFSEAENKLRVYLYLQHESVEEYEELINEYKYLTKIEKEISRQFPLIGFEIVPLSEEEPIGKNMKYFNLQE